MNLDWHADRSVLPDLVLLDQLELGEPIDVAAYATGARNMQVFH